VTRCESSEEKAPEWDSDLQLRSSFHRRAADHRFLLSPDKRNRGGGRGAADGTQSGPAEVISRRVSYNSQEKGVSRQALARAIYCLSMYLRHLFRIRISPCTPVSPFHLTLCALPLASRVSQFGLTTRWRDHVGMRSRSSPQTTYWGIVVFRPGFRP
jgi:hypothetical protein